MDRFSNQSAYITGKGADEKQMGVDQEEDATTNVLIDVAIEKLISIMLSFLQSAFGIGRWTC